MKIILLTISLIAFISIGYTQRYVTEQNLNKRIIHSKKLLLPKGNIWVMDEMKSYTGQGTTGWEYDYHEDILARNSHGLATLIETEEKIEGTGSWKNLYHAEIAYHNNDTTSEYQLKEWDIDGNNWAPGLSYYETKDEDGKILIHYEKAWDNTNHTNSFIQGNKEIYTYNGELVTIKEEKDWNNNTWEDYFKTFYYYDENNNDTLELQKRFISANNWRDNWKTRYTYNSGNQKIMEQQWGYDSYWAEWFDYSRTTYTYYANGLLKEEFTEKYDNSKSGWYDVAKSKYFYNANNLLESKEELDLLDSDNNLKYDYTYNASNQETSFFLSQWNGTEWKLFYKVIDNYDANGNQTDYFSQMFDGAWKNFQKEEYYWSEFTVNINELDNSKVKLYPNPVSNFININSEENFNLEIIDISGKSILKSSKNRIDISNLQSGVYFAKISVSGNIKTIKFVKR